MLGPQRRDFIGANALKRGDTWVLVDDTITFASGESRTLQTVGVVVRSTIKALIDDADPGLAQTDSTTTPSIVVSGTRIRIVFAPSDTETFPAAKLQYDVVVDFSATESYTLWYGEIDCTADVTRTRTLT